MFSTDDTIVAIATPAGRGGLGVVRISGPEAQPIAATLLARATPLQPRVATFGRVRATGDASDDDPRAIADHVVVTSFPAPHSYTGEDIVEIGAHGSSVVLRGLVLAAIGAGARLAEPGEFTFRAFVRGRLDLVQAEAVADLVDAVTPLQARTAFDQLEGTLSGAIHRLYSELFDLIAKLEASVDFSDEGYHFAEPGGLTASLAAVRSEMDGLLRDARRGRLIREGAQVAILGKPNVGKSSLFNKLVGSARAIVTDIPGTTRDMLTEQIDLQGVRITLVDTAGIRPTNDVIEQDGVTRSVSAGGTADLVLVVLDQSQRLDAMDAEVLALTKDTRRLLVLNKSDLPAAWDVAALETDSPRIAISLVEPDVLERVVPAIVAVLTDGESLRDGAAITNVRHTELLDRARQAVARAENAVAGSDNRLPEEFVLADLQEARVALEEITGHRTSDDLLAHIFSQFCIGK